MRIRKSANLMIAGMVILMAWLLSSSLVVADEEIENLVIGGDFEEDADLTHWKVAQGQAVVSIEIEDDEEAAVGDASLLFKIEKLDPDIGYNPILWQKPDTPIMVKKGEIYTLSMFLKAEKERKVEIIVFYRKPPEVRVIDERPLVGTEWNEYSFTFEMPETANAGVRFLNAGAGDISYWLDAVRFYAGEYVPTEIEGEKAVVASSNSLTTTWASIKAQD